MMCCIAFKRAALVGAVCVALSPIEAFAQEAPPQPGTKWTEAQIREAVAPVRAGRKLTPRTWPNNAKVAVCLSFDVDNEPLARGVTLPVPMSAGQYGATTGLPRVLRILERHNSFKNWRALGYFQATPRQMFFRERGLKQFIEAGAVMGMGTDSGTPMNFHTEALWREAKAHVDMGMPPLRVISALTQVGARILGKTRDLGTIEPGKRADVIVVKGNPLYDIVALSNVEVVVKGGVVYKGGPAASPRSTSAAQ